MNPGSLEPVHKRPVKCGPILPQRRDALGHQGRRTQVFLDQRSEPRGVFVGDLHLPRQSPHPQFKLSLNLNGRRIRGHATSGASDGNGDIGHDFSGERWTGVLSPLNDPAYFAEVTVDPEAGTIVWPGGIDLAPEPLYEQAKAHPLLAA